MSTNDQVSGHGSSAEPASRPWRVNAAIGLAVASLITGVAAISFQASANDNYVCPNNTEGWEEDFAPPITALNVSPDFDILYVGIQRSDLSYVTVGNGSTLLTGTTIDIVATIGEPTSHVHFCKIPDTPVTTTTVPVTTTTVPVTTTTVPVTTTTVPVTTTTVPVTTTTVPVTTTTVPDTTTTVPETTTTTIPVTTTSVESESETTTTTTTTIPVTTTTVESETTTTIGGTTTSVPGGATTTTIVGSQAATTTTVSRTLPFTGRSSSQGLAIASVLFALGSIMMLATRRDPELG